MQTQFVWSALADRASLGVLAGACGGLVAGLGARFAMRIVADAIGQFPALTAEGTFNILVLGVVLGLLPGAIYGVIKPWLPGRAPVHGLLVGLALFGAVGVPLLLPPAEGELALAPGQLGKSLFGLLFFVYGLAVAVFYRALAHALRSRLSG